MAYSRRRILLHDLLNLFFVRLTILLEQVVGFGLRGRFGIRIIQEILDTKEYLLDGNRWLPAFFFVENRKTNSARWVDIGVEKWWYKFA